MACGAQSLLEINWMANNGKLIWALIMEIENLRTSRFSLIRKIRMRCIIVVYAK
jgi:hypothetical protein